ncbi:hypothetical protein BpHYR1_048304 [Brachionus plicatilis]|uniref:Uncharacterized protein n=1 Tax=Brachionus plicatilis TaxID=10195 RepID=A0A3M7Q7U4_BRAPC|nr:hypothetical protein BpHYR1_048304 [Brachionus plicatilis]
MKNAKKLAYSKWYPLKKLTKTLNNQRFISEQLWKWEKIQSQAGFFLEYFTNKNLRLISTLATN